MTCGVGSVPVTMDDTTTVKANSSQGGHYITCGRYTPHPQGILGLSMGQGLV